MSRSMSTMSQSVTAGLPAAALSDVALQALQASSIDALRRVDVLQAGEDRLVLTGRVATYYYKQQAQELVRQAVRGAVLVNDIEVAK